ncbi:MAG TPA: type II toxin-antitoxin system VapC family toxin [Bradyrhizobium sp.]|nr:type II toxin-antitoxin system VapC family toxin [Bradyrhizobium sp.]
MIHLDTNVAIALLNGDRPQVRARFDSARTAGTPFSLSIIVYHELMYGAAASKRRKANEDKIALFIASGSIALLPFEAADASEAADIRAHLKRSGKPIGPYDVLIAAQARRAGTTLVTANTSEFARVPGLIVMDWAA